LLKAYYKLTRLAPEALFVNLHPRRLYDIARLRLRSLAGRARVDLELDRELSFHIDQQIDENIANGMSPEAARAAAMWSLGGLVQIQDECRGTRRTQQLDTLWRDLRYALRTLTRTPGFTIVIVLTMRSSPASASPSCCASSTSARATSGCSA